uniref:RNase H type-1 domain-containing protein n=1 Tax=Quercus lobata TaxID=97700 RepID=A0A7N2QZK1_QUELO
MGARFRVGNGKSIKIWQHHWLPIKHPPLVSSPIIESMENATVDYLIDDNTGKWNAEMLEDGQCNCKSGYKFLKDLEVNPKVWCIWNQRNKLRINHACCLTKDLQQNAEDSWNEIRRCNLKRDRISSKPQINWTTPSPNTYKINYDGAISNADNKFGIGVVVRDCQGEVIASLV